MANRQYKSQLIAARFTASQIDKLQELSSKIGNDGNLSAALRYCVQVTKAPGEPKRRRKPAIRQMEISEAVA